MKGKVPLMLALLAALIPMSVRGEIRTLPSNIVVVSEKNNASAFFTEGVSGTANTGNTWLEKYHTTVTTASGATYDCLHWESPTFSLAKGVKRLVISVLHTAKDRSVNAKTDGPYFNISELAVIDGKGDEVPLKASAITSNAPDRSEGILSNLVDHKIDTYFHSSWHDAQSPEGYYHNLVLTLPEALTTFTITIDQAWVKTRLYNIPVQIRVADADASTVDLQSLIVQAENQAPLSGTDPGFLGGDFGAYYEALEKARNVEADAGAEDEERQKAADNLKEEFDKAKAATVQLPEDGVEYTLANALDRFFYLQNTEKCLGVFQDSILWWGNADAGDAYQRFVFEKKGGTATSGYTYYMKNVGTGQYVSRFCDETAPDSLVWGNPYHIRLRPTPDIVRLWPLGQGQFKIEVKGPSGQWQNLFMHAVGHNSGLALGVPTNPGGCSRSNPDGYGLSGTTGPIISYNEGMGSASAWFIRKADSLPLNVAVEGEQVKTRTLHLGRGINTFLLTADNVCRFADLKVQDLYGKTLPCQVTPEGDGVRVALTHYAESFTLTFTNEAGAREITLSVPEEDITENLRVMTFNLSKSNIEAEGINTWANRVAAIQEFWGSTRPDLIGMQEANKSDLIDYLPGTTDYAMIGCGRNDGKESGEYNPILYNTRTIRVEKHGFFWLSTTPTKASKSFGSQFNRLCTWIVARDLRTSARFLACNTHLDHTSDNVREKQTEVLKAQIKKLSDQYPGLPVILMGDFNSTADLPAYEMARELEIPLFDAWGMSPEREGSGYGMVRSKRKLDYIFTTREIHFVKSVIHPSVQPSGLTYSDHNPQYADLRWALTPYDEANVLLEKAQATLDEALTYADDSRPLITAASQISADAAETTEGKISYLIDGNTSTYFHSQYSTLPPNQIHWLQVELNEPAERVKMSVTRRDAKTGLKDRPENIIVQASENGNAWQDITELYGFGDEDLRAYTSDIIELHGAYRYLRFKVVRTPGMRLANGSPMFTASEFQLYGATVRDDSPRYADDEIKMLAERVEELMKEVSEARSAGTLDRTHGEKLQEATDGLHEALEAHGYVESIGTAVLNDAATTSGSKTYYHLDGTPASDNSRGLLLMVTRKADGSTVVKKHLNNRY